MSEVGVSLAEVPVSQKLPTVAEILKPESIPVKTTSTVKLDTGEVLPLSILFSKEGSFTDKLIALKVFSAERIKTPKGSFLKREIGGVKEEDRPIVQEAKRELQKAKDAGRLPTQELNPFGDNVQEITMINFGDVHIRGQLSEAVTNMNLARATEVFKEHEGIIAKQWQSKWETSKLMKTLQGKDRVASTLVKSLAATVARRLSREISYQWGLDGGDFTSGLGGPYMEVINKIFNLVQRWSAQRVFRGFLAYKNSILREVQQTPKADKSILLLMNLGDNGFTEDKAGDKATTELIMEQMRQQAEKVHGQPVYYAKSPGNHDIDITNNSPAVSKFADQMEGCHIFFQEIGQDTALVNLDVNYHSTFWRSQLERNKLELAQLVKHLDEAKTAKDQPRIKSLEKEWELWGKDSWEGLQVVRNNMERQKRVLKMAKDSNRQLILMGHEEAYLRQILEQPIEETRFISIISGHVHKDKNVLSKERNKDGHQIRLLTVGADITEVDYLLNKAIFTGFKTKLKTTGNTVILEVSDVYPKEVDFAAADVSLGLAQARQQIGRN